MKAYFLSLIAGLALVGCASPKVAKHTPQTAEKNPQSELLLSAMKYFIGLQMQGKVPGLPKSDHGKLMDVRQVNAKPKTVSYPAAVVIRGKDPNDYVCSYTVVKDTVDSPWRLTVATRTDKDGNIEDLIPQ